MLIINKVITRKEVSVMFDDGKVTAGPPKDAQAMLLPEGCCGNLLEYLDADAADILTQPLVENGAKKSS
jgi:hypothetical protein